MTQAVPASTLSLKSLLTPRPSVFENTKTDTVLDLTDLAQGRIDPRAFFAENFITSGMRTLLEQGFRRLAGHPGNGVFLLRQSMGGGKTHNLITLGLLAQNPLLRSEVLPDEDLQPLLREVGGVQVVAFSGRERPSTGIWGLIAEQLGNKAAFSDFYSPLLQAPAQSDWEQLLRGRTALILLDELPPYLDDAESKAIADSNLARVTATAITNLMAALQRPGCERVALVVTDLAATAYGKASEYLQEALSNLKRESERLAVQLEPVQLNSNELYDILRVRLFEQLPDDAQVAQVRDLYAHEVNQARKMGLTTSEGQAFSSPILDAYPFHPSIRDLYARFRENPGFQQTRGLIRMMRATTAHLWERGLAGDRWLIGLQDLDLNDDAIRSELYQINPHLKEAVAHDVADGGAAVAEQTEPSDLAREAATLILSASLTTVTDGVAGLTAGAVAETLARPELDLAPLTGVLNELSHRSWYLHKTGSDYLFSSVRNINAEIEDKVRTMSDERALGVVREQLQSLFNPAPHGPYQELLVFPQLDEINPRQHQVTLVLARPHPGGLNPQLRALYDASTFQNRLMFLTGDRGNYHDLIDRAKVIRATGEVLTRLRRTENANPDIIKEIEERLQATQLHFFTAAQEAFTQLHFPDMNGLTAFDFTGRFADQHGASRGTEQITAILEARKKFVRTLDSSDARKFEKRVFTSSPQKWSDLLRRAANTPGWSWHPEEALEKLRRSQIDRDEWRQHGDELHKGPFPAEATSVGVHHQVVDAACDRYRLTLSPRHGQEVHYAEGTSASGSDPVAQGDVIEVSGRTFSFVAVDPSGKHPTGDATTWCAPTWLQGRWEAEAVTFEASPGAEVRATFDGRSAEQGPVVPAGTPVEVPPGTYVVQAVATRDGLASERLSLKRNFTGPDPKVPGSWRRRVDATATADSLRYIDRLGKHRARATGVKVTASGQGNRYGAVSFSPETPFTSESLRELTEYLRRLVGDAANVSLTVEETHFDLGQDLIDWAADEGAKININEVKQ